MDGMSSRVGIEAFRTGPFVGAAGARGVLGSRLAWGTKVASKGRSTGWPQTREAVVRAAVRGCRP